LYEYEYEWIVSLNGISNHDSRYLYGVSIMQRGTNASLIKTPFKCRIP